MYYQKGFPPALADTLSIENSEQNLRQKAICLSESFQLNQDHEVMSCMTEKLLSIPKRGL